MKKKLLSLIAVIALTFSLSACAITSNDGTSVNGNVIKYEVNVNSSANAPVYNSLVEMLDAVRPSVVEVYIQSDIAQGTGAGSGVILSKYGDDTADYSDDLYYVLTCHHVIQSGDKYLIKDIYGNEYSANLIGGDPESDIAVLSVSPSQNGYSKENVRLAVATVRDINELAPLKVGEDVVAIGNPLGTLGGTVTKGIISSVDRIVNVEEIGEMNLIQTDCSTNSGNSGGGLFDAQGNLVGVTNSGYPSRQGLNFAIPIDDALAIYKSLTETYFYKSQTEFNYGYVEGRARACVEYNYALSFGSEIAIADYSHNFRTYPACVMEVKKGSVYANAGFTVGDMIEEVKYNGQIYKVPSINLYSAPAADLVTYLNSLKLKVNDALEFKVLRNNGGNQYVEVTLTVTYKQFIYGDTGYTFVA